MRKVGKTPRLALVAERSILDIRDIAFAQPRQLLRLVTPADPEFFLQLPEGTADHSTAEMRRFLPKSGQLAPPQVDRVRRFPQDSQAIPRASLGKYAGE